MIDLPDEYKDDYELFAYHRDGEYPKPTYCPYCKKEIVPEVINGAGIYVHDDVDHPENFDPLEFKNKH